MLSRADMLDTTERETVRIRAMQFAPEAVWCEVVHRPQILINSAGEEHPLAELHGKRVAAVCAIGNPAGFKHSLESLGCEVAKWREFPDHHTYTREDIQSLKDWGQDADMVVCTRKDLVKLRTTGFGNVPLRALSIQLHFLSGKKELSGKMQSLVDPSHSDIPSQ